ncbi:hypothetical protein L208DRAFT_1458154 [Tricholoma matsutake]|nr:hypothetical protein L208DRAFT_1458154 [Tricholoma matsutake 945]
MSSIISPSISHTSEEVVPNSPPPSSKSPSIELSEKSLPPVSQSKPTFPTEEASDTPLAIDNTRVIINWEIFDQLLGLDDEDDVTRAFSKGTVQDYFDQAMQKFQNMDEALEEGHLEEVTDEAHSLKGSSAAIALSQVESTFGEIDRFREKAKAWKKKEKLSEEDAREKLNVTEKIQELLLRAKKENAAGKGWMENWYEKETGTRETF